MTKNKISQNNSKLIEFDQQWVDSLLMLLNIVN